MMDRVIGNGLGKYSIWLLAGLGCGLLGEEGGRLEIDFEDLTVSVPPLEAYGGPGGGAYYNGSDGVGGFMSGIVAFETDYNADWMSWSGWAYSTTTDIETGGFANQYSAFVKGETGGNVYAVTYAPSVLELPVGYRAPVSIKVANTSYAALSMRDGDDFAKKFGDDPATADVVETDFPDWFRLTLTGRTESGQKLGSVEVYMADFRGSTEEDYILDDWIEVDLAPLLSSGWSAGWNPHVHTIEFALESSDTGDFGMNTPSFVAVDDLELGETPRWGPYDLPSPDINTGDWLGWVHVKGDWVYVYRLGTYIYLPGETIQPETGAWTYIPKPGSPAKVKQP